MKIPLILLAVTIVQLCARVGVSAAEAERSSAGDPFSGRAWWSKFEACMCGVEAPVVFHDSVAYLYNRAHGSVYRVGAYEIVDGVAIIHGYRGEETRIVCTVLPDGMLSMTVDPLVRKMGLPALAERDTMPWVLREVKESKILEGVNKLIDAKKITEPNKAVEPTPVAVTPGADAPVAPSTSAAHLDR